MVDFKLGKEIKIFFHLPTSVGQRKNAESPWGIAPQTFGFRAPMFYHWFTKTRRWARSIAIYFFTEHKTFHLSYSIYKHDAIDIADPSSMQDAYHMNFVIDLANCRVSEVDIFFAYFSCLFSRSFSKLCLSFRWRKFFILWLRILRSCGVFISAKFCGSFNKFNTYFLRSLDSTLFFRKWIFPGPFSSFFHVSWWEMTHHHSENIDYIRVVHPFRRSPSRKYKNQWVAWEFTPYGDRDTLNGCYLLNESAISLLLACVLRF